MSVLFFFFFPVVKTKVTVSTSRIKDCVHFSRYSTEYIFHVIVRLPQEISIEVLYLFTLLVEPGFKILLTT